MIIEHLKKVSTVFVYQQYLLILLLKWVKSIIHLCFQKNANKKKMNKYISKDLEISSDELDEDVSDKQ